MHSTLNELIDRHAQLSQQEPTQMALQYLQDHLSHKNACALLIHLYQSILLLARPLSLDISNDEYHDLLDIALDISLLLHGRLQQHIFGD